MLTAQLLMVLVATILAAVSPFALITPWILLFLTFCFGLRRCLEWARVAGLGDCLDITHSPPQMSRRRRLDLAEREQSAPDQEYSRYRLRH